MTESATFLAIPIILDHNPSTSEETSPAGNIIPGKLPSFTLGKGVYNIQAVVGFHACVSQVNQLPFTRLFLISGQTLEVGIQYENFVKKFQEEYQKALSGQGGILVASGVDASKILK